VERAPESDEAALARVLLRGERHLGRREHSLAELRARLRGSAEEPIVERALALLCESGALDDRRYARLLCEDRRTLDGWGAERIRARLERAGIDGEVIEATLAQLDDASELDAARELLRRRCPPPPLTDGDRRRALGLLIRRGYESELAYEAIRRHVTAT